MVRLTKQRRDMMDWKQILSGAFVGAILGIAGTFFIFQGRVSKIEAQLEQYKFAIQRDESKLENSKDFSGNTNVQDIDWHTYWKGDWQHTEVIIRGSFSGKMELAIIGNKKSEMSVVGACDNIQGGRTTLDGHLTERGRTFIGKWKNIVTGQQGIFKLSLITPTYFEGNYSMAGTIIQPNINKWIGVKIE